MKYSGVRLINSSGDVLAEFYRDKDVWDGDKIRVLRHGALQVSI